MVKPTLMVGLFGCGGLLQFYKKEVMPIANDARERLIDIKTIKNLKGVVRFGRTQSLDGYGLSTIQRETARRLSRTWEKQKAGQAISQGVLRRNPGTAKTSDDFVSSKSD